MSWHRSDAGQTSTPQNPQEPLESRSALFSGLQSGAGIPLDAHPPAISISMAYGNVRPDAAPIATGFAGIVLPMLAYWHAARNPRIQSPTAQSLATEAACRIFSGDCPVQS